MHRFSVRTWVSFPHPPADQEVLIHALLKAGTPSQCKHGLHYPRAGAAPRPGISVLQSWLSRDCHPLTYGETDSHVMGVGQVAELKGLAGPRKAGLPLPCLPGCRGVKDTSNAPGSCQIRFPGASLELTCWDLIGSVGPSNTDQRYPQDLRCRPLVNAVSFPTFHKSGS